MPSAPPALVDKSDSRVRKMFGQIAPQYDRLNHLLSLQTDRYWRWRTTRLVPPRGTAPILDVCTGTGDLALAYLRASGGQARVVGTDFCPEMLALGEEKKKAAGLGDELRFVEANALDLPFAANEFQIVCVAFGLRNLSDTDQGLREMLRVCQVGGRVAVLEFSLPTWQPWKGVYGWYFRRVLPRIGQWLARNSEGAYEYLPASVGEFPQGEVMERKILAAGASAVRRYVFTFGVATLYVGTK